MRRTTARILLADYLLILFLLTMVLFKQPKGSHNYVPFATIVDDFHRGGKPFLINILGNLVVFLPMGLLCPYLFDRCKAWWKIAALSAGLSLIIEVAQGLHRPEGLRRRRHHPEHHRRADRVRILALGDAEPRRIPASPVDGLANLPPLDRPVFRPRSRLDRRNGPGRPG